MKFFIVLIILLVGENSPNIYTFRYEAFSEIEQCNMYINTSKDYLKYQIERQFPRETIQESMVVCMSPQEVQKLLQQTEDKKWQEQKPI